MRIWIDGYEANVLHRLGSGQVAFNLLQNLEKIDKKNEYTIFLPGQPLADLPKERVGWKYQILKLRQFWTRVALPLALFNSKKKCDLFFSPSHYLPRFCPVRTIATIFDLAYLNFPEMFQKRDLWKLKHWTKYTIFNADHLITISNFSKNEILKNYDVDKNKITVAYPGYNSQVFQPIKKAVMNLETQEKYHIEGSYIIYVGTLQPRKNLIRLIEAFEKIDNLKLVLVGKTIGLGRQGWLYDDILKRPEQLGIADKIIFAGFVPDEELKYLMNGAVALALVSLYEGFGIPVVDAMACGVPTIVSNVSSLPEIVGQAGLLVDPYSTDQIEQAIRIIYADKKLRMKKSKESLKQAGKFSWEKMAKKVLKVFEEKI